VEVKKLQEKTLRKIIENDELAFGLWIRSEYSDFIEIMALLGFDFVYLDREHTTTEWNTLKSLTITASYTGLPVMLRVEKNDEILIRKAYEIGIQGVLVPHICSKEDAEKAVKAAKFPPWGVRGLDTGVRSSKFFVENYPEYIEKSNRETVIGAMIEDKEAIDNIDEILSVKGLDFVCFGPTDYSVSIGEPGKYDDARIKKAEDEMTFKARKKGVRVLRTATDFGTLKEKYDKGVRLFIIGSDMEIFRKGCNDKIKNIVEKLRG
jgi:2-dehydro-3-deoxyglucarate aldolase